MLRLSAGLGKTRFLRSIVRWLEGPLKGSMGSGCGMFGFWGASRVAEPSAVAVDSCCDCNSHKSRRPGSLRVSWLCVLNACDRRERLTCLHASATLVICKCTVVQACIHTHIVIQRYLYIYRDMCLYIDMYIYVCNIVTMSMYMCVCYIYIYVYR